MELSGSSNHERRPNLRQTLTKSLSGRSFSSGFANRRDERGNQATTSMKHHMAQLKEIGVRPSLTRGFSGRNFSSKSLASTDNIQYLHQDEEIETPSQNVKPDNLPSLRQSLTKRLSGRSLSSGYAAVTSDLTPSMPETRREASQRPSLTKALSGRNISLGINRHVGDNKNRPETAPMEPHQRSGAGDAGQRPSLAKSSSGRGLSSGIGGLLHDRNRPQSASMKHHRTQRGDGRPSLTRNFSGRNLSSRSLASKDSIQNDEVGSSEMKDVDFQAKQARGPSVRPSLVKSMSGRSLGIHLSNRSLNVSIRSIGPRYANISDDCDDDSISSGSFSEIREKQVEVPSSSCSNSKTKTDNASTKTATLRQTLTRKLSEKVLLGGNLDCSYKEVDCEAFSLEDSEPTTPETSFFDHMKTQASPPAQFDAKAVHAERRCKKKPVQRSTQVDRANAANSKRRSRKTDDVQTSKDQNTERQAQSRPNSSQCERNKKIEMPTKTQRPIVRTARSRRRIQTNAPQQSRSDPLEGSSSVH